MALGFVGAFELWHIVETMGVALKNGMYMVVQNGNINVCICLNKGMIDSIDEFKLVQYVLFEFEGINESCIQFGQNHLQE